jgi:hypothetical protein
MTPEDVQKIIHAEFNLKLSSFITRFWYIIGGLILSSAGAWFSLYYQVQHIDTQSGWSFEQQRAYSTDVQRQIDTLRTDYKNDIAEMKADLRYIRDRI